MIGSKADYHCWRHADLEAASITQWKFWMALSQPTMHFLRILRRVEYLMNCRSDVLGPIELLAYRVYFRFLSIYLGFTIAPNTCGPGLRLYHWGTVVISPEAKIGARATINVGVNIGRHGAEPQMAPRLGDDVYIGPGAKLFGDIQIGDRVQIGANAVVNRSFPDDVVIAGVPAKVIRQRSKITSPPKDPPTTRSC